MKGIKIKLSVILALLVAGFYACQHEPINVADANDVMLLKTASVSTPVSDGGITPYIMDEPGPGGNVTCEMIGLGEFTTGKFNYDVDTGEWEDDETGEVFAEFPYEGIEVIYDPETKTLSFSVNIPGVCVAAAIVKGSNDANIYEYSDPVKSDSGLGAPLTGGGQPADLSNLTFCLVECDDEECEWIGETAWSAGSRYVARGNWATYTKYEGAEKTVTLYAGQTMNAGSATFSAAVDGYVTITITLNAGWRFAEVEENVKIQDYADAPSGNPSPGLFDHKGNATESPFVIEVPENNFYGVHLDVEWEKCPE
jgi:hypothetical protein